MYNKLNKRLRVFRTFVEDLATLSKCKDRQVAAIICDKDISQVYSIGVNGGPIGSKNCLCATNSKYTCVHAEINALVKCTVDCKDKVMICTLSPCCACAAAIVNSGIKELYYNSAYHDREGLDLLNASGVQCMNLSCIIEGASHGT